MSRERNVKNQKDDTGKGNSNSRLLERGMHRAGEARPKGGESVVLNCHQCGCASVFDAPGRFNPEGELVYGSRHAHVPSVVQCQGCTYRNNMNRLEEFYLENYGESMADVLSFRGSSVPEEKPRKGKRRK